MRLKDEQLPQNHSAKKPNGQSLPVKHPSLCWLGAQVCTCRVSFQGHSPPCLTPWETAAPPSQPSSSVPVPWCVLAAEAGGTACVYVPTTHSHVQGMAPASALRAHYGSTHSDSMWQRKERTHLTELNYNDSLEKTLMLGQIEGRRRRGWQRMTSLIQWPWTWANSWRWWGRARPGMLQSVGSQRVRHDLETEQRWQTCLVYILSLFYRVFWFFI